MNEEIKNTKVKMEDYTMTPYSIVTLDDRPDLKKEIDRIHQLGWVKYMRMDPVGIKYWDILLDLFRRYQFLLLNSNGIPVACGHAIPFYWDGHVSSLPSGWDGVIEKGIRDVNQKTEANAVSALAIVIHPDYRGQGLSKIMVKELKRIVKENNSRQLVAPVRPSMKWKYPLIPMKDYCHWQREDGSPFDPWIRTHWQVGASIITVAEESMIIPAPIERWEAWLNMKFPSTGSYIIEDGLVPLEIDRTENSGVYIEPNVWMKHVID